MPVPPFHLAFPVDDLAAARHFYGSVLACPEGRSSDAWIDFDFFGHQIVAHLQPASKAEHAAPAAAPVDGHDVPIPHFGIVLSMPEWKIMRDKLVAARTRFVVEPHIRFEGQAGEQATMFFRDPAGNALEFKAMADPALLFAR